MVSSKSGLNEELVEAKCEGGLLLRSCAVVGLVEAVSMCVVVCFAAVHVGVSFGVSEYLVIHPLLPLSCLYSGSDIKEGASWSFETD